MVYTGKPSAGCESCRYELALLLHEFGLSTKPVSESPRSLAINNCPPVGDACVLGKLAAATAIYPLSSSKMRP
jgi:hypothetical protein